MYNPEKLDEFLQEQKIKCPCCKNSQFDLHPQAHIIDELDQKENKIVIGKGFGIGLVTCRKCNFVLSFRATNFS